MTATPPPIHGEPEGLDAREYFAPLWRRRWMILSVTVVAALASFLLASSATKHYSASSSIYIQVAEPTLASIGSTSAGTPTAPTANQLSDIAQLMTTQAIQTSVRQQLNISSSTAANVVASASADSDFVTVTSTAASPSLAAQLANAYAKAYLTSRSQSLVQQARQAILNARSSLNQLPARSTDAATLAERDALVAGINEYTQTITNPQTGAYQTTTATAANVSSSPRPRRDAAFAAALAFVFAVVLAYLLEVFGTRLSTVEDLERAYDRPLLGILPKVDMPAPFDGDEPTIPDSLREPLRMVRFQIRLNPRSADAKLIVVTSGVAREGKSTLIRNLALVYAGAGQRVLVVDADLRAPDVARLFRVQSALGLLDVLSGDAVLADVVTTPSELLPLDVLSSGTDEAGTAALDISTQLASPQMLEVLRDVTSAYDVVLVDTAPILAVADCFPLLPVADIVLLASRVGVTTRQQVRRITQLLDRVGGVRFAGLVATAPDKGTTARYGYTYAGRAEAHTNAENGARISHASKPVSSRSGPAGRHDD